MLHKIIFANLFLSALLFSLLFISSSAAGDEGKKPTKDIVTIAVESDKFNTLVKALTETGLVEALKGDGPFTVFAPTDDAFAKLPEGTIEKLLEDKETLKSILLFHVVSGSATSEQVVKLDKAETLAGQNVKVRVNDDKVMINDSQVITADIMATNGIIHIIDTVLIPE